MRVEEQVVIEAPAARVWHFVTDPDRYDDFMMGLTRWEAQGELDRGLGARYAMRMEVGSAEVGGLIEVVEFDEPRDMAWTSVTGLDQRGRWRLRERERGRTVVSLRISYQAPGGLLATLADRVSAPLVRRNLRDSLANLKRVVEEDGRALPSGGGPDPIELVSDGIHAARVLAGAGLVHPVRPDRLIRAGLDLARWGPTPAAGYAASAARYPDAPAIVDERGSLTFEQVHRRTNALAHALSDAGVLERDGVAIMCRNHRGFCEATVAASKLGANALFLNTSFAGPQLTEVVRREKPKAIVYDQEFAGLLEEAGKRRKRFVAWVEDEDVRDDPSLEELISAGDRSDVVPPEDPGKVVILTSGTTGTPKGASRGQPGVGAAVSILSRIPLRARSRVHIAAPLFHAWGIAHFQLGLLLSSTLVLQRKFDPEGTLATIAAQEVECCPMVPVMLQRILALDEEVRRRYDTSSLKTVPVSGSALPGDLAERFMDEFGDVLYNLYGSTEVAWAAIATPEDLRAAPGTSGIPPRGTALKILDDDGNEVPRGEAGRIFVGNEMLFEGYTGGGGEEMVDGLMATGDLGRLDERGRLFVEGRDDEMIVSGGENVYPQEVEDLLARHERVEEAAVVGVDDEDWGQRLEAFVVPRGKLSEKEVLSYVKENLARYKVPRRVELIDELPRNQTGKILKRELVEG
jgi:fatty-acyl-CoA synthase